MAGLFNHGLERLSAAASSREKYQTVISSNIANADTPHFKADKRTFSDFLETKMSSSSSLGVTHPNHINTDSNHTLALNTFNRSTDEQRMDGNTVDVEHEMATLAENQLMYELNMKILQGKLSSLANVIKEGGR